MNPLLPRTLLAALTLIACLPLAQAQETFTKDARGPTDPAHQPTLYVVPYAHLDTQWRWSYPQVIREFVRNTLRDNFPLMDKYPNYVFNFSGSRRYEMMREYYPQDYERLKKYIAAGQWFPCGSSVDEADANVPSLESMVRQVLYGNRYFRREFGKASDEFMLPDCFGFPASLPTILAHCGIKGFSTQKLTWGSAVGIPFKVGRWIGPDGRSVVAALDPGGYGDSVKEDLSRNQTWLRRITSTGNLSGAFVDYHYYGTGDRGGSPTEDAVRWVERSMAGSGPVRVVSSPAEKMFNDLTPAMVDKLPSYQGDMLLTQHSAGSITSQAYMKRWNRKNELLASAAESAAVAANWLGAAPYPAKKLYDAWDLLLGSQMHDMLPGTSLPKAYEYCWNDELLAANFFGAVAQDSAAAVIGAMDTRAEGVPVAVYNPLSVEREDVVEASIELPGEPPQSVLAIGPDGQEVPAQITGRHGARVDVLLLAKVPALGFAVFDVREDKRAERRLTPLTVASGKLENGRYTVSVNAAGDVEHIFDHALNRELLSAPMQLEFQYENPEKYPAWNMDWSDRQKPPFARVEGPAKVRVVEQGPVRVALEIEREAQGSRFVQQIRLSAGGAGDRVEFKDVIEWQSRECSLKAAFHLAAANPEAAYDDKIGVVMRGNNEPKKYEVPQHEWLDLSDRAGGFGASILTDSKFGSDKPDDHTLRLTLLYTPGTRGGYQDQGSQDIGRHDMLYALAGHPGGWQEGDAAWRGRRLNQPLRAFQTPAHEGKLGRAFALLALNDRSAEISALKKAEDSDEFVVRVRNLTAKPLPDLRLAMPGGQIAAARELDGQEREMGRAQLGDGQLRADLPPFGLRAFAVRLTPAGDRAAAPPAAQPVTLSYDQDVCSTTANPKDGAFDEEGVAYPAELIPATVVSEGIPFRMGPTANGQKNALACRGQTIDLPEGDFNRVYLLAAAANGNKTARYGDGQPAGVVQDWGGYVGQWDNRLWEGKVPELAYGWNNKLAGLLPGYVRPDPVAWYASHRVHPQNGNEFYEYCYLFKYSFKLAPGARRFTLPDDPTIRVFALTVAKADRDEVRPAAPLFDTLEDHLPEAPRFTPAAGRYQDALNVTLHPPLYYTSNGVRVTTDGSEPTEQSSASAGPMWIGKDQTLKARAFLPASKKLPVSGSVLGGPVAQVRYEVRDTTPPTLKQASASTLSPEVRLTFSEPVDRAGAENAGSYLFDPVAKVRRAVLGADDLTVRLILEGPLADGGNYRVSTLGVPDRSAHNASNHWQGLPVTLDRPVFRLDRFVCDGANSLERPAPTLPLHAGDKWTLNFFVRTDAQPPNRTLIAGFGSVQDDEGRARYLSKFANGIHYWTASRDGDTQTALDVGKWQMLTATYDGAKVRLYKNGEAIGEADIILEDDPGAAVHVAPVDPWDHQRRFKGEVRELTIWPAALSGTSLQALLQSMPPP